VHHGDDVLAFGAQERLGDGGDPLALTLDRIDDDLQFGGGGRWIGTRGSLRHHTQPIPVHHEVVGSLPEVIPVRDDLRALEGYHSPQVDVRVRLNTNESPLPPPVAWRDALAAELSQVEWHRYPDRQATELRAAIAQMHGVTADMVFAANGSNEVLQTILLTYAGAGRTVATFEPTYQMHAQIARVVGSSVVEGERDADFSLDPAEMRRLVESARPHVTFLTSPNNPTGLVEPAERVEELLQLGSGLVVVDEAYAQFADWSALSLIDEQRPLVVTRTFSKTWSMAGIRLGYVIGPTWFISELDKVVLPYHLDVAKQIAGRLALRFVDDMDDRVRLIVAERERLSAAMRAMAIDVTPSGANFILFRPRSVAGRDLWQGLLERSVLVRDCSSWPRLANCLRVTVGTPDENKAFLTALDEVLTDASVPVRPTHDPSEEAPS
jgi:histidinol-phosphate aminotransferase